MKVYKPRWKSAGYGWGQFAYYWKGSGAKRELFISAHDRLPEYVGVAEFIDAIEQVRPLFVEEPDVHSDIVYEYGNESAFIVLSGVRKAFPAEKDQVLEWEAHVEEERAKIKQADEDKERAELARLKEKYGE
jgi:hypothetical protein